MNYNSFPSIFAGYHVTKQQVENNDHSNITDHFNNNSNCYNDKFTLQEMQDAIADTNNSAPGQSIIDHFFHNFI
jgi:hypothetical protein